MEKKILPLFCILFICIIMIRTGTANAQGTIVAFDPITITVDQPGTMFAVNITVTNAPNMTQWTIRNITWNPSVLQLNTTSQIVEGPFLKAVDTTVFLSKPPNNTEGRLPEVTCATLTLKKASGNGTLCTIWFFAKTTGVTQLCFGFARFTDVDTLIYPETVNGTVTVVPEFPASMLLPLFLGATTIAIIAATVLSRKRRIRLNIP